MNASRQVWWVAGAFFGFAFLATVWFVAQRSVYNPNSSFMDVEGWSEFPALPDAEESEEPIAPLEYRLSGPYTQANLSVYLIHGEGRLEDRALLTLPEALEADKIVVYETQEVNQLAVENRSAADEILLLSGDVLKGGQQDRVVQFDMLLPPNAGKTPLPAFCVEQTADRWMGTIDDGTRTFAKSSDNISGYSYFSSSSRISGSQSEVWTSVKDFQKSMGERLKRSVRSPSSVSSLQLSLENEEVRKAANMYTNKLVPVLEGKTDVLGYAFVINGKVRGADTYASCALFRKVWSRMLRTNAVEAFVSADDSAESTLPVSAENVDALLAAVENGKCWRQSVTENSCQYRQENGGVILFEAAEKSRAEWIRRQYLLRDVEKSASSS